jgi:hypothetical protein
MRVDLTEDYHESSIDFIHARYLSRSSFPYSTYFLFSFLSSAFPYLRVVFISSFFLLCLVLFLFESEVLLQTTLTVDFYTQDSKLKTGNRS